MLPCCLTSLMKERETQAACVLAVREGNLVDNRNIGRLRLSREPIASVETSRLHGFSSMYAMRSFSGGFGHRRAVSNLRV